MIKINVRRFASASKLLEVGEAYLLENEAANNLSLGVLYRSLEQDNHSQQDLFAIVEDANGIVLVMIKTSLHLILAGNSVNKAGIDYAVSYLSAQQIVLPSVIGPLDLAHCFAEKWAVRKNLSYTINMRQRIYRLDRVIEKKRSTGRCRKALPQDIVFLRDWVYDFSKTTLTPFTPEEARIFAEEGIKLETIYIWEDDQQTPVSIAKKVRSTKNGAVIGLVYTPPVYRKKGYASAFVAALSQQLLDEGYSFCSLYTDLSNPTSNHIYMDIGYQPVVDSIVYQFD